jgi:CheY-like chemotaxis protein
MSPDERMVKILLVEDSPTQAIKLQRMLESCGFEVVHASDGLQALTLFGQFPFDLVLSDVVMPAMTGFELCRAIKSNPETAHVPVILLTSLCEDTDRERGLRSGADEFVRKPYDPKHLLGLLSELIDKVDAPNKEPR